VTWAAAFVIAAVLMWRGLRWWARLERRAFGELPPIRSQVSAHSRIKIRESSGEPQILLPEGEAGHLAFADELLVAARAYRNECARRAGAGPLGE